MKTLLSIAVATVLLASAASASPLSPAAVWTSEASKIHLFRMVCNEYGRCWRSRGPRVVYRGGYDDGYYAPRRSYGYYGGGPAYFGSGLGRGGFCGGGRRGGGAVW